MEIWTLLDLPGFVRLQIVCPSFQFNSFFQIVTNKYAGEYRKTAPKMQCSFIFPGMSLANNPNACSCKVEQGREPTKIPAPEETSKQTKPSLQTKSKKYFHNQPVKKNGLNLATLPHVWAPLYSRLAHLKWLLSKVMAKNWFLIFQEKDKVQSKENKLCCASMK